MAPLKHLAHIRRFGLLGRLPSRQQRRLLGIARQGDFGPGERIFSKQDAGDYMFVVVRGRVRIFLSVGTRRRKTFAYLGPGDFFGEMAVITGESRSASAEAVEPTSLLMIGKRDFRRLLASDVKFCIYLLEVVTERLLQSNQDIEDLLFRNVLGRVAKALRDLAEGEPDGDGRVDLPRRYTHQDLADLVGTTREPLSRALGALRRAGLVDCRSDRISLIDLKRLDEIIEASVHPD